MVNAKFANQKHRVVSMIWKQIRYLPFLPQICLSVCIYLLHICPEQICTNTVFRAVRVLSGKWLNLSSSIWVEKFRFTFIEQDRIIFTKITAVIMLNFSDARVHMVWSLTLFDLPTHLPMKFSLLFLTCSKKNKNNIYLLSTTVFYSVCQISSTTEQRIFSIVSLF